MSNPPLTKLLSDGWVVHMRGVVEIDNAPLAEEKIEKIRAFTNNKVTHIVFLNKGVDGKIIYPITDESELNIAQCETKENSQIIGYDLTIHCRARCLDGEVDADSYANNIIELTDWNIEIQNQTQFTVTSYVNSESKEDGYKLIDNLQNILISLSIKNKIGIIITYIRWGARYKAQPFSFVSNGVWQGKQVVVADDINKILQLKANGHEKLLSDLVEFYGQLSPRTKLITGFSILESLFDSKPKPGNILNNIEKAAILKKLGEIESISSDKDKLGRLTNLIHDSPILLKETKNMRLAAKLSKVMNITNEVALKKIQELAKLRGKAAHSITEDKLEFKISSDYIEEVLLRHLFSKAIVKS